MLSELLLSFNSVLICSRAEGTINYQETQYSTFTGAGDMLDVMEDGENPGTFIVLTSNGILRLRPGEAVDWIEHSPANR